MSEPEISMEMKLRMLMSIAAGEPPRPVTVAAVRRGVARRRMGMGAGAALAVVLMGGIGVALAAGPGARPQAPTGATPSVTVGAAPISTAVPRYYIAQTQRSTGLQTTVRATVTGAVRAEVHCPWPAPNVLLSQIVPASNQTFFMVCQMIPNPVTGVPIPESRIYRFMLTGTGRITGYHLIRGGTLSGLRVRDIAVTPDGSELAAIVLKGTYHDWPKTPAYVLVINTRTGQHAVWHDAPAVSGRTVIYPIQVSLTADGSTLTFLTLPQCFQQGCKVQGNEQLRVASPADSGGQLNDTRVLVQLDSVLRLSDVSVLSAVVSPDGSTVTLAIGGNLSSARPQYSVDVVQFASTGQRRVHFIYRLITGNGYGVSFFSADPSASHFLIGASRPGGNVAGWIRHGRVIPLKPSPNAPTFGVVFEVW